MTFQYVVTLFGFKHGDPVTPWPLAHQSFETGAAASKFIRDSLESDSSVLGKVTRARLEVFENSSGQRRLLESEDFRRKLSFIHGGKSSGANVVFSGIRKVAETNPFEPDIA